MKILSVICVIAMIVVIFSGCMTAPPTNTASTNTTTPPAPPSPTAPPAADASTGSTYVPVTLPVLDAFFADDAFAPELKAKLGLTDEQVEKLRTIAREETAKLRESEGDDHSGTTATARDLAAEQIRAVIGEEKAPQLAALVRERWATGSESGATPSGGAGTGVAGGDAALASKSNAIPTDTRIVVNAPAYRMDVFENGQLVKTYKVGIGYPEFPLPVGLRKASSIIFNPTWTPPDEPWVESANKVKAGEKIAAGSKLNPLGLIKIPIGLPSLIHGGKSPAKLGSFASHGCVGLTNPQVQDFAQVLAGLGGTEITKEDVAAYAKKRTETKNVKLDRPVPVELRYETIVAEDGKLRIYRDVYDRDTNTEENLRAVLEAHGVSLDDLSETERTRAMEALDQMARDAKGRPSTGSSDSLSGATSKNTRNNTGDKVTRTFKGKKEVVIEIAALRGKGYPAPAGGGGSAEAQQQKKGTAAPAAKPTSEGRR